MPSSPIRNPRSSIICAKRYDTLCPSTPPPERQTTYEHKPDRHRTALPRGPKDGHGAECKAQEHRRPPRGLYTKKTQGDEEAVLAGDQRGSGGGLVLAHRFSPRIFDVIFSAS